MAFRKDDMGLSQVPQRSSVGGVPQIYLPGMVPKIYLPGIAPATVGSLSTTVTNVSSQPISTSTTQSSPNTKINKASTSHKRLVKTDELWKGAIRLENTGIYYFEQNAIGSGATSFIYRGFHNTPQRKAAIKRILLNNSGLVKIYKNELDVWLSVTANLCKENLNIVQLFEWSPDATASSYYFAMELAETDLEKRVKEFQKKPHETNQNKLIGYLQDAATGLIWLHTRDHPIIHRDIKPQNILIFKSENGVETAKLADFGISRILENSPTGTNTCGAGTESWMSPEAVKAMCSLKKRQEFRNTTSMDIFSLGMTFHYALSQGEHPFENEEELILVNIKNLDEPPNKLKGGKFLSANHLFRWMMKKDSGERPTILQVINHCFFYSKIKCLEFIVDVAKCLANKHCPTEQAVQIVVDAKFSTVYRKVREQGQVNWKGDLGDDVFQWLTRRKSRGIDLSGAYDETSGMSLVILIRDKLVHYTDLVEEAVNYFGEKGQGEKWHVSENKYAEYFISKFPELVPLLWTTLALCFEDTEFPILGSLKAKYKLDQFKNMPHLTECIEY